MGDKADDLPKNAADLQAMLAKDPAGTKRMLAGLTKLKPNRVRKVVDGAAAAGALEAYWPLPSKREVEPAALAAFVKAYGLTDCPADEVAAVQFQTEEDWHRYVFVTGGLSFVQGGEVQRPMWLDLPKPAAAMTHAVRPEDDKGEVTIGLFADFGNGQYVPREIARRLTAAKLPYACHLGDVYYGGSQTEIDEYLAKPLAELVKNTELFVLAGNHEMYEGGGAAFQKYIRDKAAAHPGKQRQRGEMFRLKGKGFQVIGVDNMFVGYNSGEKRWDTRVEKPELDVLDAWLTEGGDDLTILLTSDHPWDVGKKKRTRLFEALEKTIRGRVDLWFWGNVHYAALYEPYGFGGTATRRMVGSCIGHGGYPYYTQKRPDPLPAGVACRWLETKSRFWPETKVRPDLGLNGWCELGLKRDDAAWRVTLTYKDWVGRDRLRAALTKPDGGSIRTDRVDESVITKSGAAITWKTLP